MQSRRDCALLGDSSARAYACNACNCGCMYVQYVCTLRCDAWKVCCCSQVTALSLCRSACSLVSMREVRRGHVRGTSVQAQQGEVRLQIRYGTFLQGCVWKDLVDSHRADSTGLVGCWPCGSFSRTGISWVLSDVCEDCGIL